MRYYVVVDALTGNIVESKIETPAMEAKEKKEDLAVAETAKRKERLEEKFVYCAVRGSIRCTYYKSGRS